MAAADVLSLADALVLEFQNRITLAGILDTMVSREYEVTHDLASVLGRRIEIYPLTYNPDEDATRIETFYDFRYSFVVMRRYAEKGRVPKTWIDGEVDFVEEYVFNPLDQRVITAIVGEEKYWTTEVQVASVYDYDFLKQHKVFWSEVETVFRKVSVGL